MTDVVERVRQLESLYSEGASASESPSVRREAIPTLSTAASTARSIMELDPSLVDRLADDVIRKVDRRVRIECERRGL